MYIVLTIVDTQEISLFIFFIEFMNKIVSIETSVYEWHTLVRFLITSLEFKLKIFLRV